MSEGWSLTESDPAIFTGILKELGVKGLEVEELYALDPHLLEQLQPIKALIFLFKWVGHDEATTTAGTPSTPQTPHYFAHQVITNACGSMALLNAVMNIDDPTVELGEELANLKAFSEDLSAEDRGWTVSGYLELPMHNSFARADPFSLVDEARSPAGDDDAYHFLCYVPIDDKLYELDGLQAQPICHGVIPSDASWTDLATQVIEQRIATYSAEEVMFNLLAVTSRSGALTRQIDQLTTELHEAGENGTAAEGLKTRLNDAQERQSSLETRFQQWDIENSLRRHNHVGLIHALLLEMACQDRMGNQIAEAKATMTRKIQKKEQKGSHASRVIEE